MVAVTQKPSVAVVSHLEKGTAGMNCNGNRTVVRDSEVQVGIRGAKQNRFIAPNRITNQMPRLAEAQTHELIPVAGSRHRRFLPFRIENDPPLEGKEAPKIDDAQRPIKSGHLRAKVGSSLLFSESLLQSAIAKFHES